MSHEQTTGHDAGIERPTVEGLPHSTSDDSTRGLLKTVQAPTPAKVNPPMGPEGCTARIVYEPSPDEPGIRRYGSRQLMRRDPPPGDGYDDRYTDRYDEYYDDRYERRPFSRSTHDYGHPRRMHSQREMRYRGPASIVETPIKPRGSQILPTPPTSASRKGPEWHDAIPSDEDGDEGPPSPPKSRGRATAGGSPPPEEILRLPFTMWMNSNAKNRMCPPARIYEGHY